MRSSWTIPKRSGTSPKTAPIKAEAFGELMDRNPRG